MYNYSGDSMNKKRILIIVVLMMLLLILFLFNKRNNSIETDRLMATVLYSDGDSLTIQDKNNIIYTFNKDKIDISSGMGIVLEYSGLLDKNRSVQNIEIISYETNSVSKDEDGIPNDFQDNGMFSAYYKLAYDKLNELTLDEKIGQILLVRYPNTSAKENLKKYKFGGFLFFEKDFKNKTKEEVISMIEELQDNSKIPLLTAVDEEGGKVVRVSSNSNLVNSKFKSSQELYNEGGFDLIKKDTKNKSKILNNLGLNLNLAPVVDVSTNPNDYIYSRTLGENTSLTSEYAKVVIEASKDLGVSYTLKHFPGYGNNIDTHTSSSMDIRSYEDILNNDLPPFEVGIKAGAEAVLVSHNIVNSIDPDNPASLSSSVHNLLRNKLGFTGVVITDDLGMSALDNIDNATIKAILSGNDLIITTDYKKSINEIKNALNLGLISENQINKLAFRVLAWKYYKGLMFDSK